MPTVPRYTRQIDGGGPVTPRAVDNAPAEAFGGGSALQGFDAARQVATNANEIALKAKQNADNVFRQKKADEITQLKNDLEWNKDYGAMFLEGERSFGAIDEYVPRMQKGIEKIAASANSPQQRMEVQMMGDRALSDFTSNLNKHIGGQTRKVDTTSTNSLIQTTRSNTILNAYTEDPDVGIERIVTTLSGFASRHGVPKEALDAQVQEEVSKTNLGLIKKMADDGRVFEAKARYEKVMGKDAAVKGLTAEDDDKIKSLLETSTLRARSQMIADSIVAKGMSYSEALAAAKSVKGDAELRDAVTTRVKQDYADMNTAKEFESKARFESAFKVADNAKDPDAIPNSEWDALEPWQKQKIIDYTQLQRDGIVIQTKPEVYNKILRDLSNPQTSSAAAKQSLLRHATDLSQGDMQSLQKLADGVNKDDADARNFLDSYLKADLLGSSTMRKAGLDPKKNPENYDQFMRGMVNWMTEYKKKNGQYPGEPEMQQQIDIFTMKVSEEGSWFSKPAYKATPGKKVRANYKSIPKEARESIERGLKKRGMAVTEQEVETRYNNWLNRGR